MLAMWPRDHAHGMHDHQPRGRRAAPNITAAARLKAVQAFGSCKKKTTYKTEDSMTQHRFADDCGRLALCRSRKHDNFFDGPHGCTLHVHLLNCTGLIPHCLQGNGCRVIKRVAKDPTADGREGNGLQTLCSIRIRSAEGTVGEQSHGCT
jgi:hypothetical protein